MCWEINDQNNLEMAQGHISLLVILLSTWVFKLLEMCINFLVMLLGLQHIQMAGYGGLYRAPTKF
jgi:hypothetical protein